MVSPPSRTDARRRVWRLATAHVISLAGSQAAFTALLYTIYRRTGSTSWVAVTLLGTFGARGLLSPIAGSLGDRFDRRRVMIASDLAGAACFGALALVHQPGPMVGMAFLAAVCETPFFPATGAAIPNLVDRADLAWANGTVSFGSNVGYLVGPALGGILVAAVGPGAVFAGNAVTFVASAALVASVSGSFSSHKVRLQGEHVERAADGGHARQAADRSTDLRAGLRFIAGDPVCRRMIAAFSVFLLAIGSVLVAELPLTASFGVGSVGYGLIGACWGAGALVGALGARRLEARTEIRALVGFSFVTAIAVGSISLLPAFPPILAALAVAGVSDSVVDVAILGILQRRTPDEVRSRVLALFEGVPETALALSFLFGGALVGWLGPKSAYALAGVGLTVTGIMLLPLLHLKGSADIVPAGLPGSGQAAPYNGPGRERVAPGA
jgi:ENTS family enterobactin (siderophore) exporter